MSPIFEGERSPIFSKVGDLSPQYGQCAVGTNSTGMHTSVNRNFVQ